MSYTDRTLYCRDCNAEFVFTAGEQEFFESRGFTNAPTRCPSCRSARRNQGGSSSRSSDSSREPRQMFTAICASCGNEARVPFQPRADRPVYCSNCYQPQSSGRRSSGGRGSRW